MQNNFNNHNEKHIRFALTKYNTMKTIYNFPEYSINEDGSKIVREDSGKVLRHFIKDSIHYVTLRTGPRNMQRIAVHLLVAKTYLNHSENKYVKHLDGNKSNNHYSNLKFVSLSEIERKPSKGMQGKKHTPETKAKQSRSKRGTNNGMFKGWFVCYGEKFESANQASKLLKIAPSTVIRRCNNPKNKNYYFLEAAKLSN